MLVTITVNCGAVGSEANKGRICAARDSTAGFGLRDSRSITVATPPESAFEPIRRIGGDTGWYYADWLWHLRGAMDRMAGVVGLRRGRRDPRDLRPN